MALVSMTVQEQLARRMVARRKLLRMTQGQLAQRIGTSQAAIARLEAAQGNPTIDFIQRVVTVLDCDVTLHVRPQTVL